MKLFLGILFGALALIAYAWLEKRINQQACMVCGFRIARDAVNEPCPRCAALINPLEAD